MSQPVFASLLADRFTDFVTFRRSGGADYIGRAKALSYFDRFLSQQGFNGSYPTREILDCYLISLNRLHPDTRSNRLSVVRQFCSYLRQFEPRCYVPEPGSRAGQKPCRIPHIFTDDEIKALLVAAHQLSPPGSLRPMTYYTMFGLLYTTGLRVGEAIALDLADVDLGQQRLYVRQSKFRKPRWVPISSSTCSVLQRYIQERTRIFPAAPQDPFLVNLQGRRFFHQIVYRAFRQALKPVRAPWRERESRSSHPRSAPQLCLQSPCGLVSPGWGRKRSAARPCDLSRPCLHRIYPGVPASDSGASRYGQSTLPQKLPSERVEQRRVT